MWQRIKRIYLYGAIHISLMGAISFYLANLSYPKVAIESFIFGLSVFIYYNLCRVVRVRDYNAIQSDAHLSWISKNLTEILIATGLASGILVVLSKEVELFEIFPPIVFVLCILYIFLRNIRWIKNITIALVWTLCTTTRIDNHYFFATLVIFITVLSIIYDKKDLPQNKPKELYYLFWVDVCIPIPYLVWVMG